MGEKGWNDGVSDDSAPVSVKDILLNLPPHKDNQLLLQLLTLDQKELAYIQNALNERDCIQQQTSNSTTINETIIQQLLCKIQQHFAERHADSQNNTTSTVVSCRSTISIVPGSRNDDGDGDRSNSISTIKLRTYSSTHHSVYASGAWATTWIISLPDRLGEQLSEVGEGIANDHDIAAAAETQPSAGTRSTAKTSIHLKGTAHIHLWYGEPPANVHTKYNSTTSTNLMLPSCNVLDSPTRQQQEAQIVDTLLQHIITWNDQAVYPSVQQALQHHDSAFRKLRRVLPITRTRFAWDVAAQRNVRVLQERSRVVKTTSTDAES